MQTLFLQWYVCAWLQVRRLRQSRAVRCRGRFLHPAWRAPTPLRAGSSSHRQVHQFVCSVVNGEIQVLERPRQRLQDALTGALTLVHPIRRAISTSPRDTASETLAVDGTRRKSRGHSAGARPHPGRSHTDVGTWRQPAEELPGVTMGAPR